MFCSPSKLKENKILKNRTISFETATKTRGNMVVIATLDRDAYIETLAGPLFRPTQLLASYIPRKIKPLYKQAVITNQKEFYAELRAKTKGRIKRGKTLLSTYNSLNVVYDFYNSYTINTDVYVDKGYHRQRLQNACFTYFENWLKEIQDDPDYDNVYLVFPMVKPYPEPQKTFFTCTDFETIDPLALFIQAIKTGRFNEKDFPKIKRVIFYAPKGDLMVATDIHGEAFKESWMQILQKIRRLNSFNAGEDTLDDEIETVEQAMEELTPEDKLENKKEEIKQIVLKNIAKTIKANNLNDFEAATRDERDIMVSIDAKVEKFISKPENKNKTIGNMVDELEQDTDIKAKAIRYVETKKASVIRSDNLSKNLDRETELLSSIQNLSQDGTSNDAPEFKLRYNKYMDQKIKRSRLNSIDEEYNQKQREKDLASAISAFSESEYSPMTVSGLERKDSSTNSDEKETWSIRYKTDDGKNLSVSIDVPKVYDKRYLYLGGNKKVIKKQLTRLPIVKTKPDRVEITTNYNKITISRTSGNVSRKNQYIFKKLKELEKNPAFEILYGDNRASNSKMGYNNDFEYEELAGTITKITSGNYFLNFNRDDIANEIALTSIPDNYINANKTPLGFIGNEDNRKALIYIENSQVYFYNIERKASEKYKDSLFEFLVEDILHLDMSSLPSIGKNFMYTKMKFLASNYPVLTVVASQVGLTNVLNRYDVKYYKRDKSEKRTTQYVEVKFKDCYLYYEDTPKNTLLLNALNVMNTQDFNYADFDADRPYTKYFMMTLGDSVGIHTRNMLRINLNVVVDPITVDVLRDLKQPDNIVDMLLYANTLLVGNQYKPINDVTNYRLRSNEIVPATLYKVIADSYVNYARHRINGKPINLNVPKTQLIKELVQMTNINDKSTLNPTQEAEEISQASAKGPHGVNRSDAYTLEMRSYDDSMYGVLSANATPFSGSAGITRSISYDPKLNNVRGYIPYSDGTESGPNVLSPTEMLSPFTSACADASRQAMQVAQTNHTMPIKGASKQLIGTGINKTLAYIISDDFCFKAKKAGIIDKIDTKNQIVLILYDDGTRDAIDLDDKLSKNSNMGFYIHQKFKLVYKEKEHFDADDILAYNPDYFTGKGKDVDYKPGVLAKVAVASGDFAFEDSTFVSESLCDKCSGKINMLYQTVLGKNAVIHKLVKKGDKVKTGEALVEFTSSFADEDTNIFLQKLADSLSDEQVQDLTYEKKVAKFEGEVTKVEILYNCPENELSSSIQKIIKDVRNNLSDKTKALEGTVSNIHVQPLEPVHDRKNNKAEFPEEGGIIINIWLEYIDRLGMGDKITFMTALKGVVSKVVDEDKAPLCDYRPDEPIEAILTPTGIISRMTCDIYYNLYGNKVLVELGKQIREIWKK